MEKVDQTKANHTKMETVLLTPGKVYTGPKTFAR